MKHFSNTFNKALDALLPDNREHPAFEAGMTVAVYYHAHGSPLVGYGRILETTWSEFDAQYTADILMYGCKEIRRGVLACDIQPASWKASITRSLLKCVEGGFPEFGRAP